MTAEIYLLFKLATSLAVIMLVWFNTDALVEWARLLNIHKLIGLGKLVEIRENDPNMDLMTYLSLRNNFLTRLVTCPTCLCVWLSIITTLLFLPYILWLPLVYLSLCLYGILIKLIDK